MNINGVDDAGTRQCLWAIVYYALVDGLAPGHLLGLAELFCMRLYLYRQC